MTEKEKTLENQMKVCFSSHHISRDSFFFSKTYILCTDVSTWQTWKWKVAFSSEIKVINGLNCSWFRCNRKIKRKMEKFCACHAYTWMYDASASHLSMTLSWVSLYRQVKNHYIVNSKLFQHLRMKAMPMSKNMYSHMQQHRIIMSNKSKNIFFSFHFFFISRCWDASEFNILLLEWHSIPTAIYKYISHHIFYDYFSFFFQLHLHGYYSHFFIFYLLFLSRKCLIFFSVAVTISSLRNTLCYWNHL